MRSSKIQTMARCALSACLMALCAWITIPGPVPFTMQTFGLFLTLMLLGGKQGCLAIGTYLLMGLCGLPVFSGFQGGIGALAGPTGGYLFGFMSTCLLYWLLTKLGVPSLPALLAGYLGCCCLGTVWYLAVFGGSFRSVISVCVVPFLIPDAIKLVLAHSVGKRLGKIIRA